MADAIYTDLLFTDDDLTLDSAGEPVLVFDRDCITQDIKHLIRDSGKMVLIIGQRDTVKVNVLLQELMLLIEEDVRLIPGTVDITSTELGVFFVTADTYEFGTLTLQVTS